MTENIAIALEPATRARILMELDHHLRETINNEELFMVWLEEGVPDGTKDWRELADVTAEEFVEMWNLAEKLMNEQLLKDSGGWI